MKMHFPRNRRGSALVLTLAVLSIVSVMLLSFLITAQLDGQSTANYSQNIRAQELGLSALQEVTDGLLQEIKAGSNAVTENSVTIYTPKTGLTSAPFRRGFIRSNYGTEANHNTLLPPSLVAVSRFDGNGDFVYPTDQYSGPPVNPASNAGTDVKSANGRWVSPGRWNKPMILSGNGTVPSNFVANPPDWIYVTRAGSKVLNDGATANNALFTDPKGANANAVLGRYAYVIYNEGGLLDVTVAGFNTDTKDNFLAQVAGKNYLAYADLTVLPGITAAANPQQFVDDLVNWRNKGGIEEYERYASLVPIAAQEGFKKFQAKDNPLLTRQDLIDYFQLKNAGTPGLNLAVPYLSTFSRAVNAPSWRPKVDAPYSEFAYATNANEDASSNRHLPNVRNAEGQPLVSRRFPLSRLDLLSHNGPVGSATDVKQYFGLTWEGSYWNYNQDASKPGQILTLAEVAEAGREPDFFELLKAVILRGSLAQHPGLVASAAGIINGSNSRGPVGRIFAEAGNTGYSQSPDRHIVQIGANIIDQWDEDSYPTAILLNIPQGSASTPELERLFKTLYGTEDLPYLTRLVNLIGINTANNQFVDGWLQPELWNPHQDMGSGPDRPEDFRIRCHGAASTYVWSGPNAYPSPANDYDGNEALGILTFADPGNIFRAAPKLLTSDGPESATSDHNLNIYSTEESGYTAGNRFAAIHTGTYGPRTFVTTGVGAFSRGYPEMTVTVEYEHPSHGWLPYSFYSRYAIAESKGWTAYGNTATDNQSYPRPDPRTDRFSASIAWEGERPPAGKTFHPTHSEKYRSIKAHPRKASESTGGIRDLFTFEFPNANPSANNNRFYLGALQINQDEGPGVDNAKNAYYKDPDDIVRPGDGYRRDNSRDSATADGAILFTGTTTHPRRPVILNRPFISVGELGYVYRDLPMKSIDFWSPFSGDAGLLDVFCIEPEPEIVAGQLDLNAASHPVIKAALLHGNKSVRDPTMLLEDDDANVLSSAIANYIKDHGALQDRSDLVVHNDGGANLSNVINDALPESSDKANKAFGEAPVRALAPIANFRTWNLMIDVIAQSGRMSKGANALSDFTVEGEKRYWLHVAIDRHTGEIIDQQLEPVYE